MTQGDDAALPAGLSRREALKRGAVVAGGVVWTAPVIQVLGLTEAQAAVPSGESRPPRKPPVPRKPPIPRKRKK
jgi:hypothetical protein